MLLKSKCERNSDIFQNQSNSVIKADLSLMSALSGY